MNDIVSSFRALRRPKLLIRAARLGLDGYRRARDLPRIARTSKLTSHERTLADLMDTESGLELRRRAGDTSYSVCQHVDVLMALMGEARLLPHLRSRSGA